MNGPLDEEYLTWLYAQVASVRQRSRSKTYWSLLRQLYVKEFVWWVPNDDNRVEDGRDLRYEFFAEMGIEDQDLDWTGLGCSMLEMLIGLSRRLEFEGGGLAKKWFWVLIDNLGLSEYHDNAYSDAEAVDEILDCVIWRNYHADGRGGLFPLEAPEQDQTKIEIWYQLSAYILERI